MYKYLFRITSILLISGFCFNASATDCNAVETDVAVTQYEVKYKKVMMCQDYSLTTGACTGANDYVVGDYDYTCDLMTAEKGGDACSYGSLAGMPMGETYDYIWAQAYRDFTVTASATMDSGSCTGYTVRTESDNTNAASTMSRGITEANGSTNPPEPQVLTLPNMNGNDTTGCTDACIAQAKGVANSSCDSTVITVVDTANTNCSGANCQYTYTLDACTPSYAVWFGGLNSSQNYYTIIYKLTTPYTVGPTIPKLRIRTDTYNAFSAYYHLENVSDNFSMIIQGDPLVVVTLED